jgi:hypothetical protein
LVSKIEYTHVQHEVPRRHTGNGSIKKVVKILIIQPSSAAAERAFSIQSNSFGEKVPSKTT